MQLCVPGVLLLLLLFEWLHHCIIKREYAAAFPGCSDTLYYRDSVPVNV